VKDDPVAPTAPRDPGDRDVDRAEIGGEGEEAPKLGGALVAGRGALSTGEHGGEPAVLAAQGGVTDRVDAAVQTMEPAGLDAAGDLARREVRIEELREGDDAVLAAGEAGNRPIWRWVGAFRTHTIRKAPTALNFSPLGGRPPRQQNKRWRRLGAGPAAPPRYR
jgi:hypothetical protein